MSFNFNLGMAMGANTLLQAGVVGASIYSMGKAGGAGGAGGMGSIFGQQGGQNAAGGTQMSDIDRKNSLFSSMA